MSDIATPGPIDPNSGQPDHHAEVVEVKSWLRQNAVSLLITAGIIGLVLWKLDPVDTVKVVLGLGFIIFIHELGHFLAAKWCDVHVKTFSIGFGPAVPFCSYRWGETTYMLGIIPLGGYVSMVGEGTGESTPDGDPDDDDTDPRSFKNKPVGQRMLIISAGVIMNFILGMACFVTAYLHGVSEMPATAGVVESGGAAWRAGIRTGDDITRIGSRENPFFEDIRPVVMSTLKDEQLPIAVRRNGKTDDTTVEPIRDEDAPFPQLGIMPPYRLTLGDRKRRAAPPAFAGTPAGLAKDPGFERGDRLVGMTDPADPTKVTPFRPDPTDPARPDFDDYYRRMVLLAEQPVTFQVARKDDGPPVGVKVAPALRHDLGVRFQMGKVAAVRRGGPADGKVTAAPVGTPAAPGDVIAAVGVADAAGKRTWFANGPRPAEAGPADALHPLDPLHLPRQLADWAAGFPEGQRGNLAVDLVVLREVDSDHRATRHPLALRYDDSFRFDREAVNLPNSPLPVSGLGLAYWVNAVVVDAGGPAEAAKPQAGDVVAAVRFKGVDGDGKVVDGEWRDIKPHQWAAIDAAFQGSPPHEIDLKVKRGDETKEYTLRGTPDPKQGLPDRGLRFELEERRQTADGAGDAIRLGWLRTIRFVKTVYQNLYGMVVGRISPKTLSGPLTIATVSYRFAGEDFWQFLLFIGMISVNLAVVTFLP
ncbi:MAG TPA: site-2 protease family protein, partial [Urbifossiella sp.]|nr:site-2 protease family protein [Urbifossiella sp.]